MMPSCYDSGLRAAAWDGLSEVERYGNLAMAAARLESIAACLTLPIDVLDVIEDALLAISEERGRV